MGKRGQTILEKMISTTDRTNLVTLKSQLALVFELHDAVGQSDRLWRNRLALFFQALDDVVSLSNEEVDPAYVWILAMKMYAKLSITVGTQKFQETTSIFKSAIIDDVFRLKFCQDWPRDYGQWKIAKIEAQFALTRAPAPPRQPRPAQYAPPPATQYPQKGKPFHTPPKAKEERGRNKAACMRHWIRLAVPSEPECMEPLCSFTHAAPWTWARSAAVDQVSKYFKTQTRQANKAAVLAFVESAYTTVLTDVAHDAKRAANSTL